MVLLKIFGPEGFSFSRTTLREKRWKWKPIPMWRFCPIGPDCKDKFASRGGLKNRVARSLKLFQQAPPVQSRSGCFPSEFSHGFEGYLRAVQSLALEKTHRMP